MADSRAIRRGLGAALLVLACNAEFQAVYELEGLEVKTEFSEAPCSETLPWMVRRLRWLAAETGVPTPGRIVFHWMRGSPGAHCPEDTGGCWTSVGIFSSLRLWSHEAVHAHLGQFGSPRPWLTEGVAVMLEDEVNGAPAVPQSVKDMMAADSAQDGLSYHQAGKFVRFLREYFGMPALMEFYRAAGGLDHAELEPLFAEHFGYTYQQIVDEFSQTFFAANAYRDEGSLDCDFPELARDGDAWTAGAVVTCDAEGAIGPFFDYFGELPPYASRFWVFEVTEAGLYTLHGARVAGVGYSVDACAGGTHWNDWEPEADTTLHLDPGLHRVRFDVEFGVTSAATLTVRPAGDAARVITGAVLRSPGS